MSVDRASSRPTLREDGALQALSRVVRSPVPRTLPAFQLASDTSPALLWFACVTGNAGVQARLIPPTRICTRTLPESDASTLSVSVSAPAVSCCATVRLLNADAASLSPARPFSAFFAALGLWPCHPPPPLTAPAFSFLLFARVRRGTVRRICHVMYVRRRRLTLPPARSGGVRRVYARAAHSNTMAAAAAWSIGHLRTNAAASSSPTWLHVNHKAA